MIWSSDVGILMRSFLRRDRWLIAGFALGTTVLYYSQAVSVKGLSPTQRDFDRAAASMAQNSSFIAMAGPARALNTVGGQVMWQASAFGAILAGLKKKIFSRTRRTTHTRERRSG